MKKIPFLILSLFVFISTNACDICGCGVGGNYIGILPEFHKHIFGVRYRSNSLKTHLGVGGSTTYLTATEQYHTMELWGGWNIKPKFRVMAAIPYSFNERTNLGISKSKNGISDISVLGFYQLFYNSKAAFTNKILVQTLWLGGGIKLPTGKYNADDKQNTMQNTNLFQLGTASVDFTVNTMYDLRIQDAGLNISGSYKMNTANKYGYNYGNKLNATAQLYYKFKLSQNLTLAPNTGVVYEMSKKDIDNTIPVDISGGNLLQGSVGVETVMKKVSIGANWQTPLAQNLANNVVRANNKIMIHFSLAL
jgi:hypothetical protein